MVLAFVHDEDGELIAEEPREARSAEMAISTAWRLSTSKTGTLAFARTGDPGIGEYADAGVLARYGVVPEDVLPPPE